MNKTSLEKSKKMNFIKSKQIAMLTVLIAVAFSFTQCKNTKEGVKEDLENIETSAKNETRESLEKDKMYFDYKMEHAKVLLDLEEAKAHFILENDKFKAEESLNKAEKHLLNLEKTPDNDYRNFIVKIKADIAATKQSIKRGDNTANVKLEKLSNDFSSEINNLENKISLEKTNITNDTKRHYAELSAKKYILKARLASSKTATYAKADSYLDKADQEYVKAKQYGNEKYKTTIEDLRKNIQSARNSIQAKEKNSTAKIDVILYKLGSYSNQLDTEYPYILIP